MAAPDEALVQLEQQLAQVIDIRGVQTPTQEAIPADATPSLLRPASIGHAWADDWRWINDRWDNLTSAMHGAPLGDNAIATKRDVKAGIQAAVEPLAGYITELADLAATMASELNGYLHLQTMFFERLNTVLSYRVAQLEAQAGSNPGNIDAKILQGVAAAEAYANQVAVQAAAEAQQWSVDNIFKPLTDELGAVNKNLSQLIDTKVVEGVGIAEQAAANALGPVAQLGIVTAGELAALAPQVARLAQEAVDCVEPMCAQFGPKTDFSKLWNALKALLGIFSGLAIASLTESEVEQIAHAYDAVAGQSVDSFVSTFVEGGGTLGAAGAGVLGELTTVGGDVLHVLGVPGF